MPRDNFVLDAQDILSPLLEELGFTLSRVGAKFAEYKSPHLTVRLFQCDKSNTIGFEISRGQELLNIAHLLKVSGASNPGMTVIARAAIRQRLTWLRDFLSSQFCKLLLGDEIAFQKLVDLGRSHDDRYASKLLITPIVERAGRAFHEKRYQEVVDLLGPLEPQLGSTAKRKLSFAKSAIAKRS